MGGWNGDGPPSKIGEIVIAIIVVGILIVGVLLSGGD